MTSYDWPNNAQEETDVPKQATPAATDDPFADLAFEIVPTTPPASPTALGWLDTAMQSEEKPQRGRIAPVTTEEKYQLIRNALRIASNERGVTVICSEEKDDAGNLTALTFVINKRRGAKTD
jgi:hypothetical protein